MKVSDRGLAEIAGHEGIVQMPYRDSVGVWTFGIGHTKYAGAPDPAKMVKGQAQPLHTIFDLFRKDIAKYEARVNDAVNVPLKQHEFDALVSFDYNTGGIYRANLTKLLNRNLRTAAADAFMGWSRPKEIIPRRRKEQKLFRDGTYGDGMATVFPATTYGTVIWRKGKRIKVSDFLDTVPEPWKPGLAGYQQKLASLGYDPGPIDGKWGPKTSAATWAYQKDQNGELVVDGILGPITSQHIDQKISQNKRDAIGIASIAVAVPAATYAAGFPLETALPMVVFGAILYLIWAYRPFL